MLSAHGWSSPSSLAERGRGEASKPEPASLPSPLGAAPARGGVVAVVEVEVEVAMVAASSSFLSMSRWILFFNSIQKCIFIFYLFYKHECGDFLFSCRPEMPQE
jgi:hypothetical protein